MSADQHDLDVFDVDPTTVQCTSCDAPVGARCTNPLGRVRTPHTTRRADARAHATDEHTNRSKGADHG